MSAPALLTTLAWLFAIPGGLYLLLCVALYRLQGHIIFPATPGMDRTPGDAGLPFEEVVREVDGFQTHGWYVPVENHRGVVLFSHGNAGNLAGRVESIQLLRSFGFSVLAYDYGGYGISTGRPSEARCYADIRAMWDYLVNERGVRDQEILLFGRSLGAGPTADLARHVQPGAVILESAFLSTARIARQNWLFRPVTFLIRHRFDNGTKVAQITAPILIVHSPDDEVIPFAHGRTLFERANEPKTFLEIRGEHNLGFVISEAEYRRGWEAFLTPIFDPTGTGSRASDDPAAKAQP